MHYYLHTRKVHPDSLWECFLCREKNSISDYSQHVFDEHFKKDFSDFFENGETDFKCACGISLEHKLDTHDHLVSTHLKKSKAVTSRNLKTWIFIPNGRIRGLVYTQIALINKMYLFNKNKDISE